MALSIRSFSKQVAKAFNGHHFNEKKKKITASNLKFFLWNYSLFKTKLQTVTKILPSLNDAFDLTVIFYAPFDVCNV